MHTIRFYSISSAMPGTSSVGTRNSKSPNSMFYVYFAKTCRTKQSQQLIYKTNRIRKTNQSKLHVYRFFIYSSYSKIEVKRTKNRLNRIVLFISTVFFSFVCCSLFYFSISFFFVRFVCCCCCIYDYYYL